MDINADRTFSNSVAEVYESHLVPLIFEPYAVDMARRLADLPLTNVLEIAAGTGALTRQMAATLLPSVSITATDLNPAMLEQAQKTGVCRPVEWSQADAMHLPFADASFDGVVCQFGAMFFPDKSRAFAEVHRVLRPGGTYLFSVWDEVRENEFPDVITRAVDSWRPNASLRFVERIPHGYHHRQTIEHDLTRAGFASRPQFTTVAVQSRASSPRAAAIAFCQGTPLRNEIEGMGGNFLAEATAIAERALARRFGEGEIEGKIQAHVINVRK